MTNPRTLKPIVLYIIRNHPLQPPDTGPPFHWLRSENDMFEELGGLIGPFDESEVIVLTDDTPAGPEWDRLLENLLLEDVRMVVTHLAPLSSAQRQQLIGICAQTGTQLITPGDAGRPR